MKNKELAFGLTLMLFGLMPSNQALAWSRKCCYNDYYDYEDDICEFTYYDNEEHIAYPNYPEPHVRELKEVRLQPPPESITDKPTEPVISQEQSIQTPPEQQVSMKPEEKTNLEFKLKQQAMVQQQTINEEVKPLLKQESSTSTNYYPGLW